MKTYGLTGGIGSGKSSAAKAFRSLGIRVIDADQVARQVVQPGQAALEAIAAHFGPDILMADGQLDRTALRGIVFNNPQERRWLELLLHPLIRAEIERQLAQPHSQPYQLLESPLLLETDQRAMTEAVILVDLSEDSQIARASNRDGNSRAQIEAIIAAQMPRTEKLARADFVLDNEGSPEQLIQAVQALHQTLLSR